MYNMDIRIILPGEKGNRTNRPMILHGNRIHTKKHKLTAEERGWLKRIGLI